MTADIDALLVEGAKLERDRRQRTYPAKFHAGADADTLAIDYQCWVAIATWLETERFFGFRGGADPESDTAPWISWPHLDAAAQAALASATNKIAKMEADPDQLQVDSAKRLTAGQYLDKLTALYLRRATLAAIHRKVQLRRASIEAINAEYRASRLEAAA